MMRKALCAAATLVVLGAALAPRPGRAASAAPAVVLTQVAGPLGSITGITHAGDGRLFLTLQSGSVVILQNGAIRATPFLDISTLITCCEERGLLSTAFHPSYAENGFFFVNYTNLTGDTVVARYSVSSDPNVADPFTGVILLTIGQPASNHNGGQLQFGPDGYLYVGMGDGGGAYDPNCNAQKDDTLLGKMLRIDVDQNVGTPPYYGIPAQNPFVGIGGPDEAWAFGLRNPWRFSFDRLTGDLYIGDVGQGSLEEIDYQPLTAGGGQNYGWKIMEGTQCTGDSGNCPVGVPPCNDSRYTLPILEYGHSAGSCSVTGGYVYRGPSIPDLYGMYVYGDFCSGAIWAARQTGGVWSTEILSIFAPSLTTFGEDAAGELYLGNEDGELFVVQAAGVFPPTVATITPASGFERGGATVTITGGNFTDRTQVAFGDSSASVTFLNPGTLQVLTPPHAAGFVDVTVVNPGAEAVVSPGAFAYLEMPRADAHAGTRVVPPRP